MQKPEPIFTHLRWWPGSLPGCPTRSSITGRSRRGAARALIGIVGAVALALALAGCGAASGTGAAPTAAPSATNASGSGAAGGPPYPTPQEETYQGCPPQGDGGDTQLNLLKNRIDSGAWQPATLSSLLALTWPSGIAKTRRSSWPAADQATVAQDEGRPVVAEGYLLKLRHEGPESPNCHDRSARDYHVWMAASPTDSRANSMVVELTPRVVAQNPNWGNEQTILRLAGHHVRISGWLMFDQEHPEQLHQTRGTLWEIHPVMKIEVDQNGTWSDLASGNVTLARVPSSSGSGSSGYYNGGTSSSHHRTHRRRHTGNS